MGKKGKSVVVYDGNVEKALRKLKRRVQESGVLLDIRDKEAYVKPAIRRKLKKSSAKRRWKTYIESQQLPKRLF